MNITSSVYEDYLKVYINEILHLSLYLGDLIGMQAWVESESWYCVEYVFRDGAKLSSMYSDVELWKELLKELEQHI